MVRDERGRERLRQDVRRREDSRDRLDRERKTLATKSSATDSATLARMSKPKSLHPAGWNGTGSQPATLSATTARPRLVASTEGLARAFRAASGSIDRAAVQAKIPTLRSKAPLPVGWKPTPTKTSILREAAMQAAKNAKLRSGFNKPSKNESPVRGTAASLARSQSTRSLTASPEKLRLPISQPPSRSEVRRQIDTTSSSYPSEDQDIDYSPHEGGKVKLATADPIFALPSPFGNARRLQNSSDESRQSSEWSVDISSQATRRRSHTPQSPSTKENEEFSPVQDSQIQMSPAKREDVSPTSDHHRHYPGLTPSPKHRKNQASTRLLVISPMDTNRDLPFEEFDSEDEYEESPQKSPARGGQTGATSLKVIADGRMKGRGSPAFATSPRVRYNARTDSSDDLASSKMKPILTIGRGQQRRHKDEAGSRDSIKSVSWDPAIVAVGRCITGDDAEDSNLTEADETQVEPQGLEASLDFAMDNYLSTVTQSFAKLKKTNPNVITKLLAALRDLSDDESSDMETEHKRKLRLKSKPSANTLAQERLATKLDDKKTADAEPLRPSEQCSQIQDKLASVIESMQNITISDDHAKDEQAMIEAAKKDRRWGEVHPDTLFHWSKTKPSVSNYDNDKTPIRISIRAATPSHGNTLSSPAWIPATKGDVNQAKDSTLDQPKLNPLAPAFRDLSAIKDFSASKIQEVHKSLSPKRGQEIGIASEQAHGSPRSKSNWRDAPRPQFHTGGKPIENVLNSNEPIWINTSQLQKTAVLPGVEKDRVPDKGMVNTERHVDIMPALTQPHIFTVPPGFIPLIPHPGFLSNTAPYQTTYPQPTFLPSVTTTVPLITDHPDATTLSEEGPGREAMLLEAEWSQNLLKTFQAKYPRTGTRASLEDLEEPKVETAKPCLVAPPVVASVPMPELASFQPAGFQPQIRRPYVKNSGASFQQLAKKTRASVIQQELEVKIFQHKEKKAAETKEIQKKQIEKVEKILPLVRQHFKTKSVNENRAPQVSEEGHPLQIWERAPPTWEGSMNHRSEDSEMNSARHWEAHAMETGNGLARDKPETKNAHPRNTLSYDENNLVDYEALSRSSSSTVVANPDMKVPAKPWQRQPLNTQVSNVAHDRQEKVGKLTVSPQKISQIQSPLKAAAARDMRLFKGIFGRLREMSSIDEGQNPELGNTSDLQDQVLNLKNAWEHARNQAGQAQNATPSNMKNLDFQSLDGLVNVPYEALAYRNAGRGSENADPWELLTAQQWEDRASGNPHAASLPQPTGAGTDTPFKAPKYLWDFLDLEFKLDDLQNVSALAKGSSRSSSSADSAALSDAFQDARTRLTLSQAKKKRNQRGGQAQNLSEASTAVSGFAMDDAEGVQLNFDWVPHRLLSQSTVELSSDSDYLEMAPVSRLKKAGRLVALVERSAAEDAYASKRKGKIASHRAE